MNIYLIINYKNIKCKVYPYFYIGSDSADREDYMGSSKPLTRDIYDVGISNFSKIYIWKGTKNDLTNLGYDKLTKLENYFHIKYNVVENKKYYNRARATGGFETTGLVNVYYVVDPKKKIVNLPVNHPDIISKIAVGMQYGNRFTIGQDSLIKRKKTCMEKYGVYPPSKSGVVRQKLKVPKSNSAKINMRKPKSEKHKENMSLNHRNNRKVEKCDLNYNLLSAYNSIKDAAISTFPNIAYGTARTMISRACNKNTEYMGFIWKFT